MEVIVFSSSENFNSELKFVIQLFENGLETFHLRKPKLSKSQTEDYLNGIPQKYHSKIVLHNHHSLRKKFNIKGLHITREHRKKKYNSRFKLMKLKIKLKGKSLSRSVSKIESLEKNHSKFDYIFLTPIFDNISKIGHKGNFGDRSISKYVKASPSKIYALGGVNLDNISKCKEMGFTGVALLGSVWNVSDNTLDTFLKAAKKTST